MSGPSGEPVNPQGNWSVVGALGVRLILCKDQTVILIPYEDVIKIADYDIKKLFGENKDGQEGQEANHSIQS